MSRWQRFKCWIGWHDAEDYHAGHDHLTIELAMIDILMRGIPKICRRCGKKWRRTG